MYSSKERVLAAINHQKTDRVPCNYFANPAIDAKMKKYFNLAQDDDYGLLLKLNCDIVGAYPEYIGPKYHPDFPERGVFSDYWGNRTRWVEHGSGGYWDFCEFPLQDADLETVADWPLPSADDFDYSKVSETCKKYSHMGINVGGSGTADVINANGRVRSMEQVLIDLALDDEAGLLLIKRRADVQLEIMYRTLEAADGGADIFWMGEDLGTQIGPMISMELFKKHIAPIHQKFIDLANSFNIPVMMHSCGSSSWAFDEFIRMGVKIVETLQPEARDMSPRYLKDKFGDNLAFHGAVSTTGKLTFGSAPEVYTEVKETIDILGENGGYIMSPSHSIQDNTPVENVIAMYKAAIE